MKNKALALTAKSIPYIGVIRNLTGSVTGSILMQQLDYWFSTYPNGFYKFLQPAPNHSEYRKGDSWCEELAFSADEFRTAFDKIGVRYKSQTEYNKAVDKFQDKYYCSVFNKITGKTQYYRNHKLTDTAIDELFNQHTTVVDRESQSTEIGKPNPDYTDGESQSTEIGKPNPDYTEITTKNISKTTPNIKHTESKSIQSIRSSIKERELLATVDTESISNTISESFVNSQKRIVDVRKTNKAFDAYFKVRDKLLRLNTKRRKTIKKICMQYDSSIEKLFQGFEEYDIDPVEYIIWFIDCGLIQSSHSWNYILSYKFMDKFLAHQESREGKKPVLETESQVDSESITKRINKWREE